MSDSGYQGLRTLADLGRWIGRRWGAKDELLAAKTGGKRVSISGAEFIGRVSRLARALQERGVEKGDRVAIFSENRPEWHIADFACQLLGAADVPVYPTLPADQVAYILDDSQCSWVFTSDHDKAALLRRAASAVSQPLRIVGFEEGAGDLHLAEMLDSVGPSAPDDIVGEVEEEDLASVLYTSGTTGEPKGVMLTHRNLMSNVLACSDLFPISEADLSLSFLPLSHAFQRLADYLFLLKGVSIHYLPAIELVPRALLEVQPTLLTSVPRLYERAFLRVQGNLEKESAGKRRIFDWALGVGERFAASGGSALRRPHLALQRRIADRLVYGKIKERMGGRLRFAIAGGAPLPPTVGRFFEAVGIEIFEGYGLTETSPVLTLNRPGARRWGTVGQPVSGIEIRIDDDGEILARGPCVMRGYWNKPEDTAAVMDDDWFRTGDIGHLDDDGYLHITDRKKDILVTSGGKNIAPQPIEQRLLASGLLAQALVIGDNYPYITALLVPAEESLPAELATVDAAERVKHPQLLELVQGLVGDVNRHLAEHERIRRWRLLPEEFALDRGEITPTLKIRRRVVCDHYDEEIRSMYLKSQQLGG